MAVTGLERADSLLITTGKPVEAKYGPFSGAGIPAAIAEAESEILPLSIRFKGLTVGLIDTNNSGTTVVEYWFESGTADGDLVLKSSGTTVVANPTTTSSTLTSITIGTTSYAVGGGDVTGPTGGGTADTLTKWSTTGGVGIEDSEITDSGSVVKIGKNSSAEETLHINTDTRSVGFRTNNPGAAFDVNGTMRVRNELNVGATTEQSLFVEGPGAGGTPAPYYVKMGSYGQGLITGSPAAAEQTAQNLRRSAAFGNKGKVVDNYIYDTFEVPPAILEGLGTTPLTGQVLVDTPSDQVCILADFWFYRQINNNSAIGTWGDNTDLVIYPSNDLSGQTIASPYEQGYFRITNEFLTSTATGGKSGASCGLYQGNINGVDQGGMNGAWQIGDDTNNQPTGNKVYLSLATNGTAPTFPANSQTRFFIGLKYRFLSFQFGVVNNEDLIVLGQEKRKFVRCEGSGDACEELMPPDMALYSSLPAGTVVKIQLDSDPTLQCCYTVETLASDVPVSTGYTLLPGVFDDCDACKDATPAVNKELTVCEADPSEGCSNMDLKPIISTSSANGSVVKVEYQGLQCCYTVVQETIDPLTAGYAQVAGPFDTCQECIENVAEAKMYFEQCPGQVDCGAMPSKFTKKTTLNRGDVVKATDGTTTCCYTVTDSSNDAETGGIVLDRGVSASCDDCIKSSGPTVDEYRKCSNVPTGSKASCDPINTADIVFITYNSNNPADALLVNSSNGAKCCYTKVSSGSGPVTSGYSVDTAIEGCDSENLPDECQK